MIKLQLALICAHISLWVEITRTHVLNLTGWSTSHGLLSCSYCLLKVSRGLRWLSQQFYDRGTKLLSEVK